MNEKDIEINKWKGIAQRLALERKALVEYHAGSIIDSVEFVANIAGITKEEMNSLLQERWEEEMVDVI